MLDQFIRQTFPPQPPVQSPRLSVLLMILFIQAGCMNQPLPSVSPQPVPVVTAPPPPESEALPVLETEIGLASYYHPSLHGLQTASGIPFDNAAFMAAHPTYPMGTVVQVTNLENGALVVEVTITDRGPTEEHVADGVIIDLSGAVAEMLDMIQDGRVQVKVEVVQWGGDE